MQKVYLEKRTTDECDTIDTNVTTDTIDTIAKLNDIDLFLHGELESYNNYTCEFFTQALKTCYIEKGNNSHSEVRASVIKSSRDELETQLTQGLSISSPYDSRYHFDAFNIQQTSEHSSSGSFFPIFS